VDGWISKIRRLCGYLSLTRAHVSTPYHRLTTALPIETYAGRQIDAPTHACVASHAIRRRTAAGAAHLLVPKEPHLFPERLALLLALDPLLRAAAEEMCHQRRRNAPGMVTRKECIRVGACTPRMDLFELGAPWQVQFLRSLRSDRRRSRGGRCRRSALRRPARNGCAPEHAWTAARAKPASSSPPRSPAQPNTRPGWTAGRTFAPIVNGLR
jgi:hypothetical protein